MNRGDLAVALMGAVGAGFVIGLMVIEQGVEHERLNYLGRCSGSAQVWVNVRTKQVKCGALMNYWVPPSGYDANDQ